MNQLIEKFDLYFGKKAPQLPKGLKDVIVKIAPYLAIIGVILSIPALLLLLGLGMAFQAMPYGMYGGGTGGWSFWAIFTIVTIVLNIIAIPGLFKRAPKGWNFTFYAVLVGALQNLLMLNIIGLIIGLLIGLYVLFQVRPYYFGGGSVVTP